MTTVANENISVNNPKLHFFGVSELDVGGSTTVTVDICFVLLKS